MHHPLPCPRVSLGPKVKMSFLSHSCTSVLFCLSPLLWYAGQHFFIQRIGYLVNEKNHPVPLCTLVGVFSPWHVPKQPASASSTSDNYGFVTYRYAEEAFAAIESGHKLRQADEQPFDLCFGGRRQFCKRSYSDLGEWREALRLWCQGSQPFENGLGRLVFI